MPIPIAPLFLPSRGVWSITSCCSLQLQHLSRTLRKDIIEGNFYGATLASFHLFDVVDLHYHFRHDLGNRVKDGIHWNNLVHRRITNLLLAHVADAWGVEMPEKKLHEGECRDPRSSF